MRSSGRRFLLLWAGSVTVVSCTKSPIPLILELEPGQVLAAVAVGSDEKIKTARLLGSKGAVIQLELPEDGALYTFVLDPLMFVDPEHRVLSASAFEGLQISHAEDDPTLRSPVRCSLSWPVAPRLVHPGDICPPPSFVEPKLYRLDIQEQLREEPVSEAQILELERRVRLVWPGDSGGCDVSRLETRNMLRPIVKELDLDRVDEPADFTAQSVAQMPSGVVGIFGYGYALSIAPDGRKRRAPAPSPDEAQLAVARGESGFAVVRRDTQAGSFALEIYDPALELLGRTALSALSSASRPGLGYFEIEDRFLISGHTSDGAALFLICAPGASGNPHCVEAVRLAGLFLRKPTWSSGEVVFSDPVRTTQGIVVLPTHGGGLLYLERLPDPASIQSSVIDEQRAELARGHLNTSSGPVRWLASDFELPTTAQMPRFIHAGAVRERLLICAGNEEQTYVLSTTLSPGLFDAARPELARRYGPFESFCDFSRKSDDSSPIRALFYDGSWMDLNPVDAQISGCSGSVCAPAGPTPFPFSGRVRGLQPGWTLAFHREDSILRLEEGIGESFELIHQDRRKMAVPAARGAEFFAIGPGPKRGGPTAWSADPPLTALDLDGPEEIPTAAVYDRTTDSFLVAGGCLRGCSPWLRRLDPNGTVVADSFGSIDLGWILEIAQVSANVFVLLGVDRHLFRLKDEILEEIPIGSWDDVSTNREELGPDCFDNTTLFPQAARPVRLIALAAVSGLAFAGGCKNSGLRIWTHTSVPHAEGASLMTARDLIADLAPDVLCISGPCANLQVNGIPAGVYEVLAPLEGTTGPFSTAPTKEIRAVSRAVGTAFDPLKVFAQREPFLAAFRGFRESAFEVLHSSNPQNLVQLDTEIRRVVQGSEGALLASAGRRWFFVNVAE